MLSWSLTWVLDQSQMENWKWQPLTLPWSSTLWRLSWSVCFRGMEDVVQENIWSPATLFSQKLFSGMKKATVWTRLTKFLILGSSTVMVRNSSRTFSLRSPSSLDQSWRTTSIRRTHLINLYEVLILFVADQSGMWMQVMWSMCEWKSCNVDN